MKSILRSPFVVIMIALTFLVAATGPVDAGLKMLTLDRKSALPGKAWLSIKIIPESEKEVKGLKSGFVSKVKVKIRYRGITYGSVSGGKYGYATFNFTETVEQNPPKKTDYGEVRFTAKGFKPFRGKVRLPHVGEQLLYIAKVEPRG